MGNNSSAIRLAESFWRRKVGHEKAGKAVFEIVSEAFLVTSYLPLLKALISDLIARGPYKHQKENFWRRHHERRRAALSHAAMCGFPGDGNNLFYKSVVKIVRECITTIAVSLRGIKRNIANPFNKDLCQRSAILSVMLFNTLMSSKVKPQLRFI